MKDLYVDKWEYQDLYYNWEREEVVTFFEEFLNLNQKPKQFDAVLDIGCANGRTCRTFKARFDTKLYVGIELVEEAANKASEHVDRVIIGDLAEMIDNGDLCGLNEMTYDVILCLDVLEHFAEPWKILTEIRKWLSPGGQLITSVPNAGNRYVVSKLINDSFEYEERGLLDVTHLRFFTRHTISKVLSATGFKVVHEQPLFDAMPLKHRLFNFFTFNRYKSLFIKQHLSISEKGEIMNSHVAGDAKKGILKVYFGHHKCASTWTTMLIERLCAEMGIKYGVAYRPVLDKYNSVQDYIDQNNIRFLIIPEAMREKLEEITEPFRGFHIIRDPRDITVSAYFSHLYSHPVKNFENLDTHRNEIKKLEKEEGISEEIGFCEPYFNNMINWDYDRNEILELKFEDMLESPKDFFLNAFDHVGIIDHNPKPETSPKVKKLSNRLYNRYKPYYFISFPRDIISKERLFELMDSQRFEKLTGGRKRGQEDVRSHYRKGIANDWVNHLTAKHLDMINDKYPNLLEATGYSNE